MRGGRGFRRSTDQSFPPGGLCPAQRIQNLYDCRWQSYLYYGGPAQAGPDEVEGHRFVTAHGDSRSLRPHQSQLTLRQLLLQEKPFLRSTGPDAQSQWLPLHRGTYVSPVSAYGIRCASGHAAAPTCRNDTASRPSSVSADAEPLRNGMTATGSHEYFYSLRGAQPPGEGFSLFRQSLRRFLLLKYCYLAHRGMPPPLHTRTNCLPPCIRFCPAGGLGA